MSLVFANAQITNRIQGTGTSDRRRARAATTIPGALAINYGAGSTIDGIVLALDDRLLIKNQATQSQNGLYVITAGTPTRDIDFDTNNSVGGAVVYVSEGTVNASTGWLCTSVPPADIIGSDPITFALISGNVSGTTSTDTAIVRWNGNTGNRVQDSAILIDGGNNITGLQYMQFNDIAAPTNPSNGQGRLFKKTGSAGIWWTPDSSGTSVDLTAAASGGGVTSFSAGVTGFTPSVSTTGAITLSGTLGVASGGTGTATAPTVNQIMIGTNSGTYTPASLLGTTNQITVTPASNSITLSTPDIFIAPGTIKDSKGMLYSTTDGISAAGTNQTTAFALTTSYNIITTVAAGSGVRLLAPTAGYIVEIVNAGANPLNVYPATGGAIDGASTNTPIVLATGASITVQAASANLWRTVNPPTVAGAGMAVAYSNGRTVVSFAGSPLTTKGDIWVYSTADTRLPVGVNNYLLTADSTQATGLRWTQSIAPAQLPFGVVTDTIAADTNNYNPVGLSTAVQLRLTPTGATRSITGLAISGTAGSPNNGELKITNVSAVIALILRTDSTSSTAANRFTFDGKDIVLGPGQNCTVWYDWTISRWRGVATSSDGKISGQYATTGVLTPASFSTNQNDYAPTGIENAALLRLNATAIVNITGIAGGYDGRRLTLVNIGSQPITLVNQSPASLVPANRFYTGTSNTTIIGGNSVSLIYDGVSGFWRIIGGTGGAITGAGGLVQSQWVEVSRDISTVNGTLGTDWILYYSTINGATTLPQGTITVVSTSARSPPSSIPGSAAANAASATNPQSLYVQTDTNGMQKVTYTGISGNTFTGCTGGVGVATIGNNVWGGPVQTTIAAGSNNQTLPNTVINVVSTTGFPTPSGTLLVTTSNGTQRVNYTAVTATQFTIDNVLGTGTMSAGGLIVNVTNNVSQDFMGINLTTSGGALIIIMTANASTGSNKTGFFQVVVDGVFRRGGSVQGNGGAPAGSVVVSLKLSNIAAGDHVIRARWVVSSSATLSILPISRGNDNNASLLVQEVSS